MYVLFENRAVALGKRVKFYLLAEIVVLVAAFLSLIGTIGAIHYGNVVSRLKDADLSAYKTSADIKIVQAKLDAATAYKLAADALSGAGVANRKAEDASLANTSLKIELAKHEGHEQAAETKLAAQNKETSDFAHALAQQQQNMAEQAKVSPILNQAQADNLANLLRPYAGQTVTVHMTLDTVVIRLGNGIQYALSHAGIKTSGSMMDAGATYQGVSVVVHSPQDVPPLANALVMGLREAGIEVHPVSIDSVPKGQVAIYLGPN
jgi:hypothetical protein